MMNIENIDKNLLIKTSVDRDDIIWLNVRNRPFDLYGFYNPEEEDVFKRLPDNVAGKINEGVKYLALDTAGGRVRFTTNSPYVAIYTEMPNICMMSHMPLSGSSGFDMFIDNEDGTSEFCACFMPPNNIDTNYSGIFNFPDKSMRHLTVNFPLYNHVNNLYIGIKKESDISSGLKYRNEKPIVYYGSSITQGGCASRPGNSYQSVISRKINCDYINLGFSGSSRGEDAVAEYLSNIDMSIFVCDYDHNAPDINHLQNTHFRFYETFRKVQTNTPIIFVSKPDISFNYEYDCKRRKIIRETYEKACSMGDKNVYFVDGETLFGGYGRDICTVDRCHPNDLGFFRMAEAIGNAIEKIIK